MATPGLPAAAEHDTTTTPKENDMTTDKPEDTRTGEERFNAGMKRYKEKADRERVLPPIITNKLGLPFAGKFPDRRTEDEK
jgi:hypothetical protein